MSKNLLYLFLIATSTGLYLMVIKPLYTGQGGVIQPEKSVQELMKLNDQYNDALDKAKVTMAQADNLKKDYASVSDEDKKKMAIMVPNSVDKVRLLNEVLGVASDAGFALSDLAYTDTGASSGGKSAVTLSFSVKTTYPRFKSLMNNFEKSMRLYSINSVLFTAPEKEGDLTTYQVRLQTYYLK